MSKTDKIKDWAINQKDYSYFINHNNNSIKLIKSYNLNNKEFIVDCVIMISKFGFVECMLDCGSIIVSFKQLRFYKKCLRTVKRDVKNLKKYVILPR